jgi:hypothetical protein
MFGQATVINGLLTRRDALHKKSIAPPPHPYKPPKRVRERCNSETNIFRPVTINHRTISHLQLINTSLPFSSAAARRSVSTLSESGHTARLLSTTANTSFRTARCLLYASST